MPLVKEDANRKYTYADYLTWPENERWEIIDGVAYLQASPSRKHQAVSIELASQFQNYFRDRPCQVFAAPFEIFLDENEKEQDKKTIVQPDLVIVCDEEKLKDNGYHGAPSLVVEIISPSTSRQDRLTKYYCYEKSGVQEYWLVEPEGKIVSTVVLDKNGKFGPQVVYSDDDSIKIDAFPGLLINLNAVFAKV